MKSARPRVSVGLPIYNGSKYLRSTLESLLAQTFRCFELVICDNASTDDTEAICREFASVDDRVHYHRNDRNLGVGFNHRRVFELSSGEYFRWAGADDLVDPTLLQKCVDILDRRDDVVLAYPRTLLIDSESAVIEEYEDRLDLSSDDPVLRLRQLFSNLRRCNAIYGLIRAEVLERTALHGDFVGSDISLLVELALHGTFCEVPEFLFRRRVHSSSIMGVTGGTYARISRVFNPDAPTGLDLRILRHRFEYHRAAARAPLSLRQKLRLQAYLFRSDITARRQLASEIGLALFGMLRLGASGTRRKGLDRPGIKRA